MMEIFDPKSIEVNKRGQKSEQQIKEIKDAVPPGLWLYVGLGVLVFGGCFSTMMSAMGGGSVVSIFGWIIAAAGLFAALRGLTNWNLRRKLLADKVQSAEGMVEFVPPTITDPGRFIATTTEGRKLHPLGLAGAGHALPPGNYRFYFLDTRSWLLGVEPLSSAEEMKNNMNGILAVVFGFDEDYLKDCRRQAGEGALKTVEGLPKLDSYNRTPIGDNDLLTEEYYCTLGDVKFDISNTAVSAILPNIPHRAYYREGERSIAAIEVA